MNKSCPHCGVRLEPEPGFYQGAMYVGYGFTVTVLIVIGVLLYLLGDPSEWVYIGVTIAVMIVIAPMNYRYSRIVYLYYLAASNTTINSLNQSNSLTLSIINLCASFEF